MKPAGGVGEPFKFEWGRGSRLVFCRLPGPVFIMSAGSFFQTAAGNGALDRESRLFIYLID